MGIHVYLYADCERISPEAWRRVYDESKQVLQAWPNQPMRLGYGTVAGLENIPVYQRAVEMDCGNGRRGWRVSGDMGTKRVAEAFHFPESFGTAAPGTPPVGEDLLVTLARRDDARARSSLFGDKTQGEPYHVLIVAIATLVENRFPGVALVRGELSWRDGRDACELLHRALGERFTPPVFLDDTRMRERLLPALGPDATEAAVRCLAPPTFSQAFRDLLPALLDTPAARFGRELESLVSCRDVKTLGVLPRFTVLEAGRMIGKMVRRMEIRARFFDPGTGRGRKAALASIVRGTGKNRLWLTEDAWRVIEAAPPDELCFLLVLAHVDSNEWHRRMVFRALFESAALREFAMSQPEQRQKAVKRRPGSSASRGPDVVDMMGCSTLGSDSLFGGGEK